jgi:zinc protease
MGRGAGGRTRAELDAAFDSLGTSLDILTEHDGVTFEVTVLKEKLDATLALIADVLLRPDFPALEAEKLGRELLAQLDELRDDDAQLVRRNFQHTLYGDHPYGRTILGTASSLSTCSVERARAWHQRAVTSGNVLFGVAGAISEPDAAAAWVRHFAALSVGPSRAGERPALVGRRGFRLTLVDKPERTQSQILFGQTIPRWADPDYYALQVATTAFGGTFTARLMNEVRSKRGLSYGASARLGHGRGDKALVVHVFPSLTQTPETVELVLRLYREWAEGGLSDEEVAFAKGYLARSFAFNLATPEERLDQEVVVDLAGVGDDYVARYTERIEAVTPEAVRRAMQAHLRPDDLELCIVSTVSELRPALEAAGLVRGELAVVPYDAY